MSNKYYITGNSSFKELRDDELMHWKYVKREKKNGKWVYTYANDKFGIKNFIDTKITGNAYKQHAKEAAEEKRKVDNRLFDTKQHRINTEQNSKGYSGSNPEVIKSKVKETVLSKKSEDLSKEYASAQNNYKNHSALGTTKRNIDSVKSGIKAGIDAIKDKLGYDEKERLEEATAAKAKADKQVESTYKWRDDQLGEYGLLSRAEASAESIDRAREGLIAADKYYDEAVKEASRAGSAYCLAQRDYLNTPLGKLDNFKDDIVSGLEYIASWLRGDKKKKRQS